MCFFLIETVRARDGRRRRVVKVMVLCCLVKNGDSASCSFSSNRSFQNDLYLLFLVTNNMQTLLFSGRFLPLFLDMTTLQNIDQYIVCVFYLLFLGTGNAVIGKVWFVLYVKVIMLQTSCMLLCCYRTPLLAEAYR